MTTCPVGRRLHAPDRPCPRPCRADLSPALAGPRAALACWRGAAVSGAVPAGAARGQAGPGPFAGCCPMRGCAPCWRWRRGRSPPSAATTIRRAFRPRARGGAGGADDGLRAEGAEHRHQRCHHPPADAGWACEVVVRARHGLLRRADPSHGAPGPAMKAMPPPPPISRAFMARDGGARGWMPSSSTPRAAAPRSRITATCSAAIRGRRPMAARSRRWPVDISRTAGPASACPPRRAQGLTVAYHAACSLQHGQQVKSAPKDLLRAGRVSPWWNRRMQGHLCCGICRHLQPDAAGHLEGS
jgi:hypothetical protein